ncbi:protein of unknown function [Methylorubrum extorquens]|uniref:Uncharacterized protein n=1 Tax=Methylorubrum extorquens TaxID=408 RepID=A0A2N9AI28_METEX|nr:protein of unknown function [Methylorubrum extorquens]
MTGTTEPGRQPPACFPHSHPRTGHPLQLKQPSQGNAFRTFPRASMSCWAPRVTRPVKALFDPVRNPMHDGLAACRERFSEAAIFVL